MNKMYQEAVKEVQNWLDEYIDTFMRGLLERARSAGRKDVRSKETADGGGQSKEGEVPRTKNA